MEVRGQFTGAVDPPESPSPLAWWFAFAGDRLVLEERRGRLRTPHTRLAPGDRVTVELSPHDQTRGVIATVEE